METSSNFISKLIAKEIQEGKVSTIKTRFPPEPNGHLHIGHLKSICLNFGLASSFGGKCNLRMDDTNPEKESQEYIDSIVDSIRWLGFKWDGQIKYASDYFDKLYEFATHLIKTGDAFVCDLNPDQIREQRGSLTEQGINSPFRKRSPDENLHLFEKMSKGEFLNAPKTLRLKLDMSSPNISMRDPVIYRQRKAHHHRTANKWSIYPMYDFAHAVSDTIEEITHSICTLEFEDHRPLYDWIVSKYANFAKIKSHPRQLEFSRLELVGTITSKRKLSAIVEQGLVSGWDDPRMPTISGMRRRGYPATALIDFCSRIGISKSANIVQTELLEACVRKELESKAMRMMAVFNPIKIIFSNYDPLKVNSRTAAFHPQSEKLGYRKLKIDPEILIESSDFSENPPKNWKRLILHGEVRLRHSYIIRCNEIIKEKNQITTLICSIDYNTLGQNPKDRKVNGVIHWVNVSAKKIKTRIYYPLFSTNSITENHAYAEDSALNLKTEQPIQFERTAYFITDRFEHSNKHPVFNQIVNLKSSFKI